MGRKRRKQNKNSHKRNKVKTFGIVMITAISLLVGAILYRNFTGQIKGSTVVQKRDFRLTADNKWDVPSKKNYAALKWDAVSDLSREGYQLYQSADGGSTWEGRSMNYGKKIKVLNVYPHVNNAKAPGPNTLKTWMDSLNLKDVNGENLIQVTPVKLSDFNSKPIETLKSNNGKGDWIYDVVMFGTWDWNDQKDLVQWSAKDMRAFVDSGRGVLFGHDTITGSTHNGAANGPTHPWFNTFKNDLGVELGLQSSYRVGSTKVKITNNGYLMKYPFELQNNLEFTVPLTHSWGQALSSSTEATKWLEFKAPYTWNIDKGAHNANFYLITKNNLGLIQTGHSNGQSTMDERKIIANTLYNVAQVSLDTFANDYTVIDDKAPDKPNVPQITAGNVNSLVVRTDAKDNGKEYQWYVTADTKNSGVKKSDIVKETITSNTAGYFYEISDSATSTLRTTVEGYKDNFGRIDKSKFHAYVAPDNDAVTYPTEASFAIPAPKGSKKYLHVLAVDRANNIGQVTSSVIGDLIQYVDFEVERTKDEAKIVDLTLTNFTDNKMASVEVKIPNTAEIKNFDSLTLPAQWTKSTGTPTSQHQTIIFEMTGNNDLATIKKFLNSLIVVITEKDIANQAGSIKLVFNEDKVKDIGWEDDIPQLVSLLAYDEKGLRLEDGDILLDQKLKIGSKQIVVPKEIDLHDFLRLTNLDDSVHELNYIISNTLQQGKLIYRRKATAINMRQIIVEPDGNVELPKQGSIRINSQAHTLNKKIESGTDGSSVGFTSSEMLLDSGGEMLNVTPLNLGFYQLVGHLLTTDKVEHLEKDMVGGKIEINSATSPEFWLTIYVKPNISTSVYLSMVDDKLHVYYSNIEAFKVYIDGDLYKEYDVKPRSPVTATKILDIPLNEARNKIEVTYIDKDSNLKKAIWNDKDNWDMVKTPDK
ncbi:hypothetical protein I6N95_17380 [Vagococcus sp. BWB3-3]|uniref:DUF5057 domain-containing protein n=1 Tax=Vagococcus allomyrinae TaxID=2794353 RepID=A0A940SXW6_9ENTE|nr:hypothetical protein [Vagococcus allomyrinae]MBP1042793.1 hypothetical protein [Vagococcus allomyrinae]